MASSVSAPRSVLTRERDRGYRDMVRAPFTDKNGVKKGAWSAEEDRKLKAFVEKYGHANWRELPRFAGLARCGKSCRLRWMNYLRPDVRRGSYSEEEENLIIKLHEEHGNKWSMIAATLPGRTDNEIKNHWHTHLKKRATRKSAAEERSEESEFSNHGQSNSIRSGSSLEKEAILTVHSSSSSSSSSIYQILESLSVSSEAASSPRTSIAEHNLSSLSGDFWTEPLIADNLFSLEDFDGFSNLSTFVQYDDGVDLFFLENIWEHT